MGELSCGSDVVQLMWWYHSKHHTISLCVNDQWAKDWVSEKMCFTQTMSISADYLIPSLLVHSDLGGIVVSAARQSSARVWST